MPCLDHLEYCETRSRIFFLDCQRPYCGIEVRPRFWRHPSEALSVQRIKTLALTLSFLAYFPVISAADDASASAVDHQFTQAVASKKQTSLAALLHENFTCNDCRTHRCPWTLNRMNMAPSFTSRESPAKIQKRDLCASGSKISGINGSYFSFRKRSWWERWPLPKPRSRPVHLATIRARRSPTTHPRPMRKTLSLHGRLSRMPSTIAMLTAGHPTSPMSSSSTSRKMAIL